MQTQITEWSAAMMTSIAAALALFFSAIPKIFGFLVIAIVGWLLASAAEKGIASVLRSIKFNSLAERSGLADFVAKMGAQTDTAGVIAAVVKWFIRLIALVVAFDALGLPAVSDVLRQLLLWLPNVVVALVVLVIGGLAAKALSNLVRGATAEAGLSNSDFLAKAAAVTVWTFAIVVAINQLGIATALVNTLFMAVVGSVALALGLAFGLGGRDTAAEIVRKWYAKAQQRGGQIVQSAESASSVLGRVAASGSPGTSSTDDRAGSGGSGPSGRSGPT